MADSTPLAPKDVSGTPRSMAGSSGAGRQQRASASKTRSGLTLFTGPIEKDTDLTLSEQEVEACKSGSCPQDILDEINKALRSKKELQSVKVGKQGSAPSEEMVGILKDGVANIHSRVQPVRLGNNKWMVLDDDGKLSDAERAEEERKILAKLMYYVREATTRAKSNRKKQTEAQLQAAAHQQAVLAALEAQEARAWRVMKEWERAMKAGEEAARAAKPIPQPRPYIELPSKDLLSRLFADRAPSDWHLLAEEASTRGLFEHMPHWIDKVNVVSPLEDAVDLTDDTDDTQDDTVPRTPDAQYAHFKAQIDKTITLLLPELGKMVSFDLGQDSVTKMLREYLDMLQEERLELLNAYLRDKKDAEFEARARARAAEEKAEYDRLYKQYSEALQAHRDSRPVRDAVPVMPRESTTAEKDAAEMAAMFGGSPTSPGDADLGALLGTVNPMIPLSGAMELGTPLGALLPFSGGTHMDLGTPLNLGNKLDHES